jgi:hypothetical protein
MARSEADHRKQPLSPLGCTVLVAGGALFVAWAASRPRIPQTGGCLWARTRSGGWAASRFDRGENRIRLEVGTPGRVYLPQQRMDDNNHSGLRVYREMSTGVSLGVDRPRRFERGSLARPRVTQNVPAESPGDRRPYLVVEPSPESGDLVALHGADGSRRQHVRSVRSPPREEQIAQLFRVADR